MKKLLVLLLASSILLWAFGEPPKPALDNSSGNYAKELLIDNFDDANISADPTWWTFDRIETAFPEAKDNKYGLYTLKISGKAEGYYVGGMGTYVGKDASDFDTLVVDIFGTGQNSGMIRFQLYDDDNNTYQLEQDSTYKVLYDDQLEYEVKVTWDGWRTLEIPLSRFVDVNPGVGDDIWNPDQKNGSGGLLHFQLVTVATTEKGAVNLGLDNIRLIKKAG